ncbi:MAG: hypothetical protein DRJ62_07865 [Thermoprotei archaeon]|nr:MAG: hypothetical protein DRJ62_07865 [Thermoprotei archaeon]
MITDGSYRIWISLYNESNIINCTLRYEYPGYFTDKVSGRLLSYDGYLVLYEFTIDDPPAPSYINIELNVVENGTSMYANKTYSLYTERAFYVVPKGLTVHVKDAQGIPLSMMYVWIAHENCSHYNCYGTYTSSYGIGRFATLPAGSYIVFTGGPWVQYTRIGYFAYKRIEYSPDMTVEIDMQQLLERDKLVHVVFNVTDSSGEAINQTYICLYYNKSLAPVEVAMTNNSGLAEAYVMKGTYEIWIYTLNPKNNYIINFGNYSLTENTTINLIVNVSELSNIEISYNSSYSCPYTFFGKPYISVHEDEWYHQWWFISLLNSSYCGDIYVVPGLKLYLWAYINKGDVGYEAISPMIDTNYDASLTIGGSIIFNFTTDKRVYLPGEAVIIDPYVYDEHGFKVLYFYNQSAHRCIDEYRVKLYNSTGGLVKEWIVNYMEYYCELNVWEDECRANRPFIIQLPEDIRPGRYTIELSVDTGDLQGVLSFSRDIEVMYTLDYYPEPFVRDWKINATIIIGTSGPHGPCGGANAIDTVGGMSIALALGAYGSRENVMLYLDTDMSWYNDTECKVYYYDVPGLTNIITVAGPGVNQISWKYFCNPWYAPVYTYWNSTYGCWVVVTPNNVYKETDYYGTSPLRDLVVIELIYVEDEDRYVMWVSGFSGYGTRAGCYLLQNFDLGSLPIDLQGQAILFQWIDSNNNCKPDPDDTWNIIEVVNP